MAETNTTAEEIIEKVVATVVQEWQESDIDRADGNDYIRPYIETRLFELFSQAYGGRGFEMITGSMLAEPLGKALYALEDDLSLDAKDTFVERFTSRWDAWRYALAHYPRRRFGVVE